MCSILKIESCTSIPNINLIDIDGNIFIVGINEILSNKICVSLLESALIILLVLAIGGIASLSRNLIVRNTTLIFGANTAKFVDNKLTFIGIIHHELSHAIFAVLTGAKIIKCNLIKISGSTLGNVDIKPRGNIVVQSIQKYMCGIAPIICGVSSLYLIYYTILRNANKIDFLTLLFIILTLHISYHMSMSKQDLKVAFSGLPIVYIILSIITYALGTIDIEIMDLCIEFSRFTIPIISINLLIGLILKVVYFVILK